MAFSPSGFGFDVFLSFRGEDTRKNFTDHLYTALVNARINTFRDDRLEKGKVIKEELDNAIRQSRSSVIVLSKDYASSTWCLDELVMILELKRTSNHVVLPVFYDVDPSHVRKQTGIVEKAFIMHQQTLQSSSKVEKWRTALKEVADLAGMNLQTEADGHESKFIQNIVREIQDKLSCKPLSDVQEELKKKLRSAYPVLNFAEGKQLNNPTVRECLFDLKDVVYDAEDLLQEIKTEMLRQEIEGEYECSTSKTQEFISTSSHVFDPALVYSMVDQVLKRLDNILKQTKDVLESDLNVGSKVSQTIPSTSLIEDFGVCGRDDEKERLIRLLLSAIENSNKISVIPLVGMGGIGKTTLAQLLYNDDRVEHHFDIQAWAYVSEKFDVLRISQEIYESLAPNACNTMNLNKLQLNLKATLKGKKFFLVLDDMWNKNYVDWETLRRPFQFGAPGSKIIVTTRNRDVASMVCTIEPHSLMPMSEEVGWSLFEKHAFKNIGVRAHSDLEEIGRQIVKKCKGLPLAIKSLGGLLCSKLTVREWKSILNSETWELPHEESNILPSLWLSYNDLSLKRKRCFEYCSIFPKNYNFKKSYLIMLWKDVGLLESDQRKSAEEIGEDHFKDLISRSFFQLSSNDYGDESYTMHDLHNDLANFVSGEFCVRLDGSDLSNIWSRTRHVNVISDMFEALDRPKCLHTLISETKWYRVMRAPLFNLLPKLQCLRVLALKGYAIVELPDTVNNLKHLRQLDLSRTRIRRLPDTICTLYNLEALLLSGCEYLTELPANQGRLIKLSHLDLSRSHFRKLPDTICTLYNLEALLLSDCKYLIELPANLGRLIKLSHLDLSRSHFSKLPDTICTLYNLQTLLLSDCKYLTELPANLGRLIKLSHLDITETQRLERMPQDMGNLKDLQMLPKFVLDKDTDGDNLVELKKLQNLRGSLHISGLVHSSGLKAYILRDTKFLNELILDWGEYPSFNNKRKVLEKLRPYLNLESLTIRGFGDKMLGDWSGYYSSSALVYLKLDYCRNCVSLPALGQLPSLRKLIIYYLNGVVSIGSEFYYGEGSAATCVNKPFRSLQSLKFKHMNEWKEWSFVGGDDDIAIFPNLTKLSIESCPKLSSFPEKIHSHLPSLVNLKLLDCRKLECYPEEGFPSKLESLEILYCLKLNAKSVQKLNKSCLRRLTSLERLTVDFKSDGKVDWLAEIEDEGLFPSTLTELDIYDLNCETIDGAKWLGHLNSLQELRMYYCNALQCLPESGLPSSLSRLVINECPLLEKRCRRETGEDWPKIAHIGYIEINNWKI